MGKSFYFDYYVLAGALASVSFPRMWNSTGVSSSFTDTYVALHTTDPGASGTQGTNESAYTGYARVAVTRSTAGWSVSTDTGLAKPVSPITFPQATSTSTSTVLYFSVGLASVSTAGAILYSGTVSPSIAIQQNVIPVLTTGSTISET